MDFVRPVLTASLAAGGLLLAGCGHDNWYSNADPSGVYEGSLTDTVTQQTTPVVAVIDEAGNGRIMAQNGTYYAMNNDIYTNGNGVYAQYVAYSGTGSSVAGSLSGQLQNDGALLDATLTATGSDTLSVTLNFDNVYYTPSSLPTLQGAWAYTSSSFSLNLSIQPTGAFSGTDSNNCSYNGYFNLVDPQFDAYTENFTLTCGSTTTQYFGQAYYVPSTTSTSSTGTTTTPAEINFLADDNNGHFVSALVQYTGAVPASAAVQ